MAKSRKEMALAISGGGYRSTLFALGSIWRLNELGILPRINRITSVSGGSILSAFLALKWRNLNFNESGIAENFAEIIVTPIQIFCSRTLDILAGIWGLLPDNKTMGDRVADLYAKWLFGNATLQDIPKPGGGPEFIFYATSLQTGSGVRISQDAICDYKVGKLLHPKLPLAKVVGASSAFPPFFSPVTIKCDAAEWKPMKGTYLYGNLAYRKRLILTDGGVYDNMGLEAVWKKEDGFKTVLVCDAGAPWKNKTNPGKNWFSQLYRVFCIEGMQVGALRRRILIDNYKDFDEKGKPRWYGGTYWGIASEIDHYKLADAMVKDNKKTQSLQHMRTRLGRFKPEEQGNLINWGYALTDTAMRKWYFTTPVTPGKWPLPEYALGRRRLITLMLR